MKICLSGLGRESKFRNALNSNPSGLTLDFRGSKNKKYSISKDIHLILRAELDSLWSRIAHLWDETDPRSYNDSERVKEMTKLMDRLDKILDWASDYEYDYISLEMPRLMYEELPSEFREIVPSMLFTIKDLRDLPWAIKNFKMIGISSSIDLHEFKIILSDHMPFIRENNILFHGWGRTDKEALQSGIFYSVDSSSWSTGKFGNLYKYLGNLNIKVYNPRRSTSRNVKERLLNEALSLGIDKDNFLSGDKDALNAFNAHQWAHLGRDAEKVVGYWSASKEVDGEHNEKKSLESSVITAPSNDKVIASNEPSTLYSRTCNSCFLSGQCPAFQVDSDCSITTRLQVDDPSDIQALINRIIEIQGERVIFGAFAERMQNAGINPEVSKEMESLMNIMKTAKTVLAPVSENEVTIKAKGSGVLNQLFGGYGRSSGGSKPSQSQKIIDVSPLEED